MKTKISAVTLALLMVGTVFMNASIVTANTPPPPSDVPNGPQYIDGNWTVAGAMSFTNERIYLTGNLTIPVGASLTLVNTTILMNSSFAGQFHVEVNGTLNMFDAGDGFTPNEAGDSDASNITANNTAFNHLFWVRPTATMNVYDSSLQYAGINFNMPPNNESGVYIRSNNVRIEDSLIMNNNHALIFDSCFPASFLNNNVSENEGFGLGIGNMFNPFYNITGRSIHDNNFIDNSNDGIVLRGFNIGIEIYNVNSSGANDGQGIRIETDGNLNTIIHDSEMWDNYGAAVYMNSDRNITSNIYNMNISENAYGVWAYADEDQNSRLHDSFVYRNDAEFCADPDGPAALYYDTDAGILNVDVRNNSFIENYGARYEGCFGFGEDSWNTTVTIQDNYFLGNAQTSNAPTQNYDADNYLEVVMTDNFIYGSNEYGGADYFDLHSDGDLDFAFLRNVYDDNDEFIDWYAFYVWAFENMNITMNENDIILDSEGLRDIMYFEAGTGFINFEMNDNFMLYDSHEMDDYIIEVDSYLDLAADIRNNVIEVGCEHYDYGSGVGYYEGFLFASEQGNVYANITDNQLSLDSHSLERLFIVLSTNHYSNLTFSDNTIQSNFNTEYLNYLVYSYAGQELNAVIENNKFELLNGDFQSVLYFNSFEVNAKVCGNDYYGNAGINSYGGIIDIAAQIGNVLIDRNRFVTEMMGYVSDDAPMLRLYINMVLNVTISNNYFEYTDSSTTTVTSSRFVYLYSGGLPGDIRANITDNEFVFNVIGGGGIQGDGMLYIEANNGMIFTNISRNDVQFNHYAFDSGDTADLNSVIALRSDDDMFANIMDNTINAYFGQMVDTANAVKAVSNNNLTVNLEGNDIQGHWWQGTGEYDVSEFGVTIGRWGANYATPTQNAIVTTKNNIFGPGGQVSAITIATNNVTDVTMDGDTVRGAYFGDDCGMTSGDVFGNGVTLLGETIIADLRNLDIYDNRGAGIYIQSNGNSTVDIVDSQIHDNYWHGMYFESVNGKIDGTGSIDNVQIINNGGDWNGDLPSLGSGLYCINANLDVKNSLFNNPDTDYEVELAPGSNVTLLNCTFDKARTNVEGTPATITGGISPEKTIATWNAVTDGSFRITIDGISRDIAGIDFSGPITMNTVAFIIQLAINGADTSDGFVNATCIWTGSEFVISSGTTGVGSTISTLQKHSGAVGTDISGIEASTAPVLWWMDCASNATIVQGTTSHLFVKWYMHVKAEQQGTGFGLPSASVVVRDAKNTVVATGTTGTDGYCRNIVATEYYKTNTTLTPYTPHNASASKGASAGYTHAVMDISKQVIVILDYTSQPPSANAGSDQTVNQGANFTLDGSASSDDFWITDWVWKIGITTLTGEIVNHTLNIPGIYVFNLTVTDVEGFTDSDEVTITVLDIELPIADAGPDQTVNEDASMTFDGSGSSDAAGIANYTWTFTDGTARTLYGVAPTYIFAQPGVYAVTLTVRDPVGNMDTDGMSITVLDITPPTPIAGAGQSVPQGNTATISASGSADNVGITSYNWSFNDGNNDVARSGASITHRFNVIGNYTITLTCKDAAGNSAITTTWVHVVDVTPPEVLVVAPGESLTQVPLNWALIIVFNEPMDTASVEAAFSITGTSVTGFQWDADNMYVKVNLAALSYDQTYTFTIGTNATDAFGNPLTAAYTSSFTTASAPAQEVEEPGFMANNWWILMVIIVVLAILLVVSLLRGKKEEPAAPAPVAGEVPPAPPQEPATEPAPAEPVAEEVIQ